MTIVEKRKVAKTLAEEKLIGDLEFPLNEDQGIDLNNASKSQLINEIKRLRQELDEYKARRKLREGNYSYVISNSSNN